MNSLKQLLPSFLIGVLIGGTATLLAWQTTQPLSPQGNSDFTTQGVQGGGARKDIELTFGDGTTKTLGEVHTNQYLLLDICDYKLGACIADAKKYNDLFQKRSTEGNCQLLTVTNDGDLPAWIARIGAAPFVQKWSAYVVGGLRKLMDALNIQGTALPYYALIDSNGQIVVDQIGGQDLDTNFAPYCGQPKEGLYCDIDEDSFISKDGISIDPKDVPHVEKVQVGTETKYIYCDAQSCKYVSCNETTPGNDCNDTDNGITIPGTACTSPEGYPGVLDDTCTCQTNLWFCDGDLDGHKSKTPYSTDPNVVPHIKETQVGTETKFILCDANECHYVDCLHTPGDDCDDTDKNKVDCGGGGQNTACYKAECDFDNNGVLDENDIPTLQDRILSIVPTQLPLCDLNNSDTESTADIFLLNKLIRDCAGKHPDTCKNVTPVKGRSGSPDGKSINYPGGLGYEPTFDHSCTQDGGAYCDGIKGICYPNGGICYYFCQDSKGQENYTTSCAQGVAGNVAQPQNCPAQMQDNLAGCGTYCTEENNGTSNGGGTNGGGTNGGAGDAGICGPAHGKTFSDAAVVNAAGLCIGGVAVPNMVSGNGPWDWTCLGTLGAGNAYCRAETKGTKGGLCGPAHGQSFSDVNGVNAAGLCAQGVAVPSAVSGQAPWHRSCRGDLESSLCEATQKAGGVIGGSVDTLQRDIGNGAQ